MNQEQIFDETKKNLVSASILARLQLIIIIITHRLLRISALSALMSPAARSIYSQSDQNNTQKFKFLLIASQPVAWCPSHVSHHSLMAVPFFISNLQGYSCGLDPLQLVCHGLSE
jgi:hypothetical protein